jgi:hypothetical protein
MECVVTANLPFGEIEARTIDALERQGFHVQRTFSLHSALGARSEQRACPGYSILLVHTLGTPQAAPGVVILRGEAGRTFVRAVRFAHSGAAPGAGR